MADIDKSEYDKKRYFAALGMFVDDILQDGNAEHYISRYNLKVFSDKDRVRVGIRLDGLTDEQVEVYRKSKETAEKE